MKKIYSLLFLLSLAPSLALAAYGLEDANGGLPQGRTSGTFADKLSGALGSLVGSVLAFLGIIFLLLMIVGGLKWMTSGGDSKKVDVARGYLQAAVIGLIIVMSAYAITAHIGDGILSLI